MKPTKIALVGYKGRMGKFIESAISSSKIVWLFSRADLGDDIAKSVEGADVIIDFSSPLAVEESVQAGVKNQIPVIIGTTGLNELQEGIIKNASKQIPIVFAPNMSVGVNAILPAIKSTAQTLGSEYKIDIIEEHHIHKKDMPSGTSKKMLSVIQSALPKKREVVSFKDEMPPREKDDDSIRVLSIRKGETVGWHEVIFSGNGEMIRISHNAISREVFAIGACKAAAWVVGKPAGLYEMKDVLEL